jgi:hypothetical protein
LGHFEHYRQPLLPVGAYLRRLLRSFSIAAAIIFSALALGVWGYHQFEGLSWIDALLNAAMILGGMGPVDALHTTAGKLFASFYALFSGIVFISAVGLLAAPVIHRFLHRFHLGLDEDAT